MSSLRAPGADRPLRIAVIGSGISGLSAAWLLSSRHEVTLYEADRRIGGHSNTVDTPAGPVDTGFIVYNEAAYPNLTALFAHLNVPTKWSDMSLGVSLDRGRLEYSGDSLRKLFAQPANLVSGRFWTMLRDLLRFYREAPAAVAALEDTPLDVYLAAEGYSAAFRDDHLYPMAAAIWSTPAAEIGAYPAAAFIRFCINHGLLQVLNRPLWRTVDGGSREYVRRLLAPLGDRVRVGCAVRSVRRVSGLVDVTDQSGNRAFFDHVVIATHADQALRLLTDPTLTERQLLGAFRYSTNEALLHRDTSLMPKRKAVWSAWNYMSERDGDGARLSVTYWMNRLQGLPMDQPLFVTLNPPREPRAGTVLRRETYTHPTFNTEAMATQKQLWTIQGQHNTWYCGAHFGAGFHEDGLQAGLAVAEALGGVRRPWTVANESGRIFLQPREAAMPALEAAE